VLADGGLVALQRPLTDPARSDRGQNPDGHRSDY
jgi:hypothetical protein